MRTSLLLFPGLLLASCAPEDEPAVDDTPTVDPFWTDLGPAAPALPDAMDLDDATPSPLWSDLPGGRAAPGPTSTLGYFAVGNGSMFALVGMGAPANTLHGMVGPDYDKAGDLYWPDVGLVLARGDETLVPDDEDVYRLEGTAVVVTRLEAEGVALWTVDAAPWLGSWPAAPDEDVPAAHAWIVRRVVVEDLGGGIPDDLVVHTTTGTPFVVDGDWLRNDLSDRHLWVGARDAAGTLADGTWSIAATELATPRELLVTATRGDASPEDLTLPADDVVERTVERWWAWSAEGLQLEGPPRLTGLLDANRVALRTQVSARGEPCPMVFYTRMWNRDLIGPLRLFLTLGLHDDARAMLDAHWTAAQLAGDLLNSYPSANDPSDVTSTPDFEAKTTPYDGRSRAEGPSYTPLAYHALWRATGRLDRARARLGLLVRAVRGQARTDGLLTFSGDETFRPQMASSFGLPLEFAFEEETWSANSGVLWVAAAESVAELARAVDRDELADELVAEAAAVRTATEATYRRDDGALRPWVYRDDRPPPDAPYPDVALKEAWSGYQRPLDPAHLAAVDATIDALWAPEGLALLPMDPSYEGYAGLDIGRGILAGMSPGYGLWSLARTHRPELSEGARFLAASADDGGTWPEVLVADDGTALTPFYTGIGFTEAWARFRPWEGGIDMEALLVAALGLDSDGRDSTLRVSPGLPELGPLTARGVPVGDATVDLVHTPGTERHRLEATSSAPVTLRLEVCVLDGEVRVDGAPAEADVLVDDAVRRVVGVDLSLDGTATLSWPAGCP